ncbi:MAG TPA: nuclear transport factor 2 family protein [Gaiellaceae bacterium]|nr:nuclear transport factor 2 family protein [Gaiellaceae bacterium]HSF61014.1 nuclear transport factor 2 family protein [Gaiellaceae bacterium]
MTTAQASDIAARFLEALSHRDFDELAATFAPEGKLRGLVPSTLREAEGREAVAERFGIWNDGNEWELLESDVEDFADVVKLRWRVAATDPEQGRTVYEQTAYAEIGEGGIAWMNLVCSGERRAD